jgi:hypothetical protein
LTTGSGGDKSSSFTVTVAAGLAVGVAFMVISVFMILSIARTTADAIDTSTFSSTLVIRENNPTDRPIYVHTGEAVDMNGTITTLTNSWLNVELSLRSNSSNQASDKGWVLLDVQPGRNFTISPPKPVIGYQFKVQFLKEGSYFLRPWVRITESLNGTLTYGRIDADSPGCKKCAGHGITVIVVSVGEEGNNSERSLSSSPSPAMLQECSDLGIAQEKCTEEQILNARHITTCCPPGVSDPNAVSEPKLDLIVIAILASLAAAFVASIFGIRKLRGIKKKRTTEEGNRD